jgi:hypothetical protein
MNVELAPWSRTSPAPPAPVKPSKAKPAPYPARPNLPPVLSQPPSEARPVDAVPQAPGEEETSRLRNALRRGAGCEHADLLGLSAAERQACLDQLAKAQAGGSRLNFDLRGGYARNPQPFLERRPKSGCKVRAGGDKAPMGEEGVAGGLACAWSF